MAEEGKSSHFTSGLESPFGPPMIGALLRMPVDAVHRRMFERLHEHGFTDFDPAHLIVFQWPGPHGTRPSELAARLQISKQALNYLLGQLEQLGYLERVPDDHDQRGKRVTVTERGRAAIGVIREAVDEIETTWAEQLGSERFAQLKTLLLDLNQLTATRKQATEQKPSPRARLAAGSTEAANERGHRRTRNADIG
jgi:DNA-binding MarR family transcriptional regulator